MLTVKYSYIAKYCYKILLSVTAILMSSLIYAQNFPAGAPCVEQSECATGLQCVPGWAHVSGKSTCSGWLRTDVGEACGDLSISCSHALNLRCNSETKKCEPRQKNYTFGPVCFDDNDCASGLQCVPGWANKTARNTCVTTIQASVGDSCQQDGYACNPGAKLRCNTNTLVCEPREKSYADDGPICFDNDDCSRGRQCIPGWTHRTGKSHCVSVLQKQEGASCGQVNVSCDHRENLRCNPDNMSCEKCDRNCFGGIESKCCNLV